MNAPDAIEAPDAAVSCRDGGFRKWERFASRIPRALHRGARSLGAEDRRLRNPQSRRRAGGGGSLHGALARRPSRYRRSTACRSASRTSSKRAIFRPRMARPSSRAGRAIATPLSVTALREAGAVILGKTVTTEFALTAAARTDAQSLGYQRRTPGGSSSGSAAAVAVGADQRRRSARRCSARSCGQPVSAAASASSRRSARSTAAAAMTPSRQSAHGPLAASLPEAWAVAYEISSARGGDPGFPGLYGPTGLPRAVEAAPAGGSRDGRLGGGDAGGAGERSRKRRQDSNQPASRCASRRDDERGRRGRGRDPAARGSSPTTSSPGSRAGRSTPTARATQASSARRCSTLPRGPMR